MANSSRNPNDVLRDAEQKGYSRILFQQGKPVCDFELTLLGDLSNPQRLAAHYIGSGVPAGSDAFAIGGLDVAGGNFSIRGGRCLVAGHEVVLSRSTTYKLQPHQERVQPFPSESFNVYLRVFRTEITDSQDADLGNKNDVGIVTAVREKTDWEVLVSSAVIDQPDHFLVAIIDTTTKVVTDRRRKGLTMAALRDEFDALGGTGASLNARLNTSLNADGTLKNEIVNTAQLANASVNEQKLADNAVSRRTIQNGAISVEKLTSKRTVDLEVKVPRATTLGTTSPTVVPGEVIIGLHNGDEHAFLMISVRVTSPTTILDGIEPAQNGVRWMQRSAWILSEGTQVHQHQLILQNFNPKQEYKVACKAFRIAEL
jgi:hypothetical protein